MLTARGSSATPGSCSTSRNVHPRMPPSANWQPRGPSGRRPTMSTSNVGAARGHPVSSSRLPGENNGDSFQPTACQRLSIRSCPLDQRDRLIHGIPGLGAGSGASAEVRTRPATSDPRAARSARSFRGRRWVIPGGNVLVDEPGGEGGHPPGRSRLLQRPVPALVK